MLAMPITDEAKAALAAAAAVAAEAALVEAVPKAAIPDDMFFMDDLQEEKPWRKAQRDGHEGKAQRDGHDGHSKNSKKGSRALKKERKAKTAKRG